MVENPSQPSPAAHAGRLVYADPRSLPSFPSHGLRPDGAAASAAASLGWANQKPIEPWKPDETSSASAAAALAKDYRMSPSWEPTSSSAGAKAALLAVGSADAALKQANNRSNKGPHEGWGNSAATQAFHAPRSSSVRDANLSHGNSAATQAFHASRTLSLKQTNVSETTHNDRSLAAAKGAMSSSRPRAISSPSAPQPSDSSPSAASSALNGAALAHRASMMAKPASANAGAVPVTTMTRNMFTSHPPVKPEVDEQQNNEKLHQSAVAMARKMYLQQQKMLDQAKDGQGDGSAGKQPQYLNLQDAAYKQAQERLAKLQSEHENNRDLQEYYGNAQPVRRRFSMAAKLRRRSSSDGDLDDHQRSERIRQQMSLFSNKLSEVDKTKREKDREALLAAAQRNVKARLQGMDEKVYQETGMVNPSMLDTWELKAQAAAQTRHETRTVNKGKVDIGGGRFMDPEEVDAIAAKRVQPVLDDINEKAEAERERQAILRLEEEARKAEQEKQKTRDREIKEINKKLKEQEKQEEKAKKQHEREEEKVKKEEERATKAEQKRHAKEEKRKSKDPTSPGLDTANIDNGDVNTETEQQGIAPAGPSHTAPALALPAEISDNEGNQRKPEDSPTSPTSKVKGWIKNRFSRGKSIGEHSDKKKGFLGGAALRSEANASATSLENRPSSMRDVALAGKSENERPLTPMDSRGVSPVSSDDEAEAGPSRRHGNLEMMPPRPIEDPVIRKSSSPTRDSRFREEMDH
ncbi:Eisosome protein 1 [Paramyrothecium foliicola]|nr:Eisosome protein 1 [Paramyrothecium foliicola]